MKVDNKVADDTYSSDEFNQLNDELNTVIEIREAKDDLDTTQVMQAIQEIGAGRAAYYSDGGSGSLYTLSLIDSNLSTSTVYYDGMILLFIAGNESNTGALINVNGAGIVEIRLGNDTQIQTGQIQADDLVMLLYESSFNGGSGAFVLVSSGSSASGGGTGFRSIKSYGATGDGVWRSRLTPGNDTTALEAAIADTGLGNSKLFFPAGTYVIDEAVLDNVQVHLIGDGIGATIIRCPDGTGPEPTPGDFIMNYTGGSPSAGDACSFVCQDMTIDCQYAKAAKTTTGIYVNQTNVANTISHSILLQNMTFVNGGGKYIDELYLNEGVFEITHCNFYDSVDEDFIVDHPAYIVATKHISYSIHDCTFDARNPNHPQTPFVNGMTAIAFGSWDTQGFSPYISVTNNYFKHMGMFEKLSGSQRSSAYAVVQISGERENINVSDNEFAFCMGEYGIAFTAACQKVQINNNNFSGSFNSVFYEGGVNFSNGGKTIVRNDGGSWANTGWAVGAIPTIIGSTDNDGTQYRVSDLSGDTMTLLDAPVTDSAEDVLMYHGANVGIHCAGTTFEGIDDKGGNSFVITGNTFSTYEGWGANNTQKLVTGITITGNCGNFNAFNVIISENTIDDSLLYGISVSNCKNTIVSNNTFFKAGDNYTFADNDTYIPPSALTTPYIDDTDDSINHSTATFLTSLNITVAGRQVLVKNTPKSNGRYTVDTGSFETKLVFAESIIDDDSTDITPTLVSGRRYEYPALAINNLVFRNIISDNTFMSIQSHNIEANMISTSNTLLIQGNQFQSPNDNHLALYGTGIYKVQNNFTPSNSDSHLQEIASASTVNIEPSNEFTLTGTTAVTRFRPMYGIIPLGHEMTVQHPERTPGGDMYQYTLSGPGGIRGFSSGGQSAYEAQATTGNNFAALKYLSGFWVISHGTGTHD